VRREIDFRCVHEEIADELEEEFMEDDRISSNQQALQELEAFENSRYEDVGRMPLRLLSILPEAIAETVDDVPTYYAFPTQAPVQPSTIAQASVEQSTSVQAPVQPSTSTEAGPKKRGRPKGVRIKPKKSSTAIHLKYIYSINPNQSIIRRTIEFECRIRTQFILFF